MAAAAALDRTDGTPRHTAEEKKQFQAECIQALRDHLAPELNVIEQALMKGLHRSTEVLRCCRGFVSGGEFRLEEGLDDDYLRRWLRARYWDVPTAAQSIRDHAAWRLAYCPQGRIRPEEIQNELAAGKMYLQGLDRKGRAVLLVLAARHSMFVRDVVEVEKLLCYAIDRQLDLADTSKNSQRKTCVLFDLTGVGVAALDVTVMHQVYTMLSQHFVERLGKLFLYNAPMIFWATWRGFSTMVPKESLDRIEFIDPSDLTSLHAEIPLDILPEPYQGTGKYIPIHTYDGH